MASLQKNIKDMASCKNGSIATENIYRVYPAITTAETKLGLGVFATEYGKVSNVKGTGLFSGIAINTYKATNDTLLGGGLTVPTGANIDVITEGDVFLSVPKGSKYGHYIFVKNADGTLSTNVANTDIADNTLTNFRVIAVYEEDPQDSKNNLIWASSTIL